MNSYGNVDVKSIENKAYQSIETDKAKELIERLNKENILFYARYDDSKVMLQYDRSDSDKLHSITGDYHNPLRSAEMYVEQNGNMIDGVINNLPPDSEEQERKADIPPEHSYEEDKYIEVLPMIAETLDMSVSQVENLPEELREMAAIAYINNAELPKDDLKELLSHTLELTPQAADIHIEPIRSEKNEKIKETADDVRTSFSRAVQRDFSEKATEHSESPDYTQNKNKDRQITL